MNFASPLFFIGLVAVAIPIVVHLFRFRKYKKVYFSNLSPIEEIQTETDKQSRLKQILLLIARILAIVFLVVAFAQPFVVENSQQKEGRAVVCVYVDTSRNMYGSTNDKNSIYYACRKAKDIANAYKATDYFMLITSDLSGCNMHFSSVEDFLTAVDEIPQNTDDEEFKIISPLKLSSVATIMFDALLSQDSPNKKAYFISDFREQLSDFDFFPRDTNIDSYLIPVNTYESDGYIYIDTVILNAPVFMRGNVVNVNAIVKNTTSIDYEAITLNLLVNDKIENVATVSLKSNSQVSVPMAFTIKNTDSVLQARVAFAEDYGFGTENYYFVLNIANRVKILAINGSSENKSLKRLYSNDPLFSYANTTSTTIDYELLGNYNYVILNEVSLPTSGLASSLADFVKMGGTLLIVPSEKTDIEPFNRMLALQNMPQIKSLEKGENRVVSTNLKNDLYQGVFKTTQADFEQPLAKAYYRFTSTGTTVKNPVMTLANGDDFLIATNFGKGVTYCISSPLREEYTDFTNLALFVPTFFNMALHSVLLPEVCRNIGEENPFLLANCGKNETSEMLYLTSTDGKQKIPMNVRKVGGRNYGVLLGEVSQDGFYNITTKTRNLQGVAYNFSRNGSDFKFYDKTKLSQIIEEQNINNLKVIDNGNKPLKEYIRNQEEGMALWPLFLILALLMLAIEVCLLRFWK